MRTKEVIKEEINKLKEELKNVEGAKTEVYTRIVGYYRSVQNWNKGKREEYCEREEFNIHEQQQAKIEAIDEVRIVEDSDRVSVPESGELELVVNDKGQIKNYKLFYADHCPGCPPVKNYLNGVEIKGEQINASTKEGFDEAVKHKITATPTVLFFNDNNEVVERAHNQKQLDRVFA